MLMTQQRRQYLVLPQVVESSNERQWLWPGDIQTFEELVWFVSTTGEEEKQMKGSGQIMV